MRLYRFNHRHIHLSRERRVCFFAERIGDGQESLAGAHERLRAHEALEKNDAIKQALAFYENQKNINGFPDLLAGQSREKPYLMALITSGVLRDPSAISGVMPDTPYESIDKGNINVADPFGILESFTGVDPADPTKRIALDAELGQFLKNLLSDDVLKQISPEGRATNDAVLGNKYRIDIV